MLNGELEQQELLGPLENEQFYYRRYIKSKTVYMETNEFLDDSVYHSSRRTQLQSQNPNQKQTKGPWSGKSPAVETGESFIKMSTISHKLLILNKYDFKSV